VLFLTSSLKLRCFTREGADFPSFTSLAYCFALFTSEIKAKLLGLGDVFKNY